MIMGSQVSIKCVFPKLFNFFLSEPRTSFTWAPLNRSRDDAETNRATEYSRAATQGSWEEAFDRGRNGRCLHTRAAIGQLLERSIRNALGWIVEDSSLSNSLDCGHYRSVPHNSSVLPDRYFDEKMPETGSLA
jgi:hypothetical protein